jgi:pyruvate formate lyase activating enzyme
VSKCLIFDVRRFSIHDGPGIRTTVFFKGCPLACAWCHNPESQSFEPELMLLGNRCVDCGACAASCPEGAIQKIDGHWITDRSICKRCGKCVAVCYADGRQIVGREYTLEEVMQTVDSDQAFYLESGGGVTFSGGEPLSHLDQLLDLLQACKARGYHTAVDTCGQVPWTSFEASLPLVDLYLYDLKMMDPTKHKHYTGASNHLILENLKKLCQIDKEVWIRIPIIPGINDDAQNLSESAEFIAGLGNKIRVFLLPYHDVAATKYVNVGARYTLGSIPKPDKAVMEAAASFFTQLALPVQQGG